ncbi:MAG: galactose mutarotase [Bacteroidales bacterium]|nr:galactose mutarotase [Bacteroidales bacterium]
MKKVVFLLLIVPLMFSCHRKSGQKSQATITAGISKTKFDTMLQGKKVSLYTLRNHNGMEVNITNYGGRIVSLMAPGQDGRWADVVLGFDNIRDYVTIKNNFGALIGRYANRIGGARFEINGKEYQLEKNDGNNQLHGGSHGYFSKVWDVTSSSDSVLQLHLLSPDGDANYPGNLNIYVTYTLTDGNELIIDYTATTDKTTVVNLTNHAYFNLKGAGEGTILDHILMIPADNFTPVDPSLIPTGEIRSVEGTPLDFRKPTPVGKRINDDYDQLKLGHGYDHNWVLKTKADNSVILAARLTEPVSGRMLEVYTNEPGLQCYTGNFLDGTVRGKQGKTYVRRGAICLETQHFPDSPNKPEFPSVLLKPGDTYHSVCIYKFGIEK